jgi:hypothetical protein
MSGETSLITIDPDGDVTLELTGLVSSKVLSLASPVFARMFKSQFQESLNNKSTTGPPVLIPLPDENQEAFTILSNVLHYRISDASRNPTLACVENIGVICDKWNFTKAISSSAELWMQQFPFFSWTPTTGGLDRGLLAAYVDAPLAFLADLGRE